MFQKKKVDGPIDVGFPFTHNKEKKEKIVSDP
jgi:hypothetical protein